MSFIRKIIEQAISDRKTIVLPEGNDTRVIEAASILLKNNVANVVIIGDEAEIKSISQGFDISGATIVCPEKSDKFEKYVNAFYELRKNKGVTLDQARETMKNYNYWGAMMVKMGEADGMVSGAAHSTADTLRPALQIVKTAPNTKLVSGFFVMVVPDCDFGSNGTFVFADCGLNPNPDADQLSEIAIASADSFKMLTNIEPNVAMLSFSTYGSGKDATVDKVIDATKIAKKKAPDLRIDGELQVDAAIVPEIALRKAPGSEVAGCANVLIFPDLNCGNIAYKLVQRLAKAEAYGPLTQGLARPINDLSRGCSADDIVGVVALTVVQAQNI
ncbi:MAG: phosphate acetyltransferase [Clostridia bacterium]|jgi:phosphate acetyltransferase